MRHRIKNESVWKLLKCNVVATRLMEPAFTASLNHWLDVLGEAKFVTFISGSVAVRGQRTCHLIPHSVLERNLNFDQIADRATVKKMSLVEQKCCLLYLK